MEEIPKRDVLIIGGDWNAKAGVDNRGWERVMGKFGFGEINERGERLLEFAMEHEMVICNTRFQQKDCRKWTWRSYDGKTRNMIDMILMKRRWITSVQQCRSYQGADIDSDHSLVIANIKMKLKRKYVSPFRKQRDLTRLNEEAIGKAYRSTLEEKIKKAPWKLCNEENLDKRVEGLLGVVKEAVEETVPEEEKITKKWITQETLKLVQEKRILKIQRDVSEEAEKQYRAKCNEVRKASRSDKAKWLEKQCEDVEKYYGECKTREVYKMIRNINRKWQPKQTAIKDDNNKIVVNKKEVLQRWTRYCNDLYNEQLDPKVAEMLIQELKDISPPNIENESDILRVEVERAVRRLKNNKSPGIDEITGEMIKQGGECLVNEIHQLCNLVWKEGKVPKDWARSVLVVIHKKGSSMDCKNYRTIALTSHLGKVLMKVLTERLSSHIEEHLADEQGGFRKDRSTVQQILALRLIAEKARRKNKNVYNCFVDFQKAFDSIDQRVTWAVLESYGVDSRLITLLKDISDNAEAAVRVCGEIGSWFRMRRGTRQGDPISPTVFIGHLERAMDKLKNEIEGVSVHGMRINNLRFADDIDVIEESVGKLQRTVQVLSEEGKRYGLMMNIDKTKTMVFGNKEIEKKISVDGVELENVEKFTYLGSNMTYDLDCKKEISIRIAKSRANLKAMDKIWKSKAIALKTKLSILNTCVFSSMLYGCETWTLTKESQRRILAFERICYRKILRLGWIQKITNEELYRRILLNETLFQKVIQRKLTLFGHICRMSNDRKIKTLVFGIMDGKNRRGRPNREWADDIEDWCGANLQQLSHSALNRQMWKTIVKRASDTNGR